MYIMPMRLFSGLHHSLVCVVLDCRFVQKFIDFLVVRISSAKYVSSLNSNDPTSASEIGLHESLAASKGGQILPCLQV